MGPIWLEGDGEGFPEVGWTDFPVVILGWWLSALTTGKPGESTAELAFMDGPWEAGLRLRGGECHASLRRSRPAVAEWEGAISLEVLRGSVLAAGSAVVRECDTRGWTSSDISVLRSYLTG
ncbi:hypothetical protein [Nonomuraea jabiensis]|uniref:Uncharacterized protein n=1 Tax=Nonomuraea jabiensis TaxID=882448 RepID=A0A7W9LHH0_9ACTN|nr:hypothetical protein [Nonomuraea jabiensis]MBB5783898.1 hypothetical protein [Nonomuraea jabiensis]